MRYLLGSISSVPKEIHQYISASWSRTRILVFAAILAALAAILQSAGGLIPGVGFLISPFATLPILIIAVVSRRYSIFAYVLSICLLFLIEPNELFIFPFTTGLLGLGLGWGYLLLRKRLGILALNSVLLFTGICIPLYILGFPVFGSETFSDFSINILLIILCFSFIYSWLWIEIGLLTLKRLKGIFLY